MPNLLPTSRMLVVRDAAPLSNLAIIGSLELLRGQFGTVHTTSGGALTRRSQIAATDCVCCLAFVPVLAACASFPSALQNSP